MATTTALASPVTPAGPVGGPLPRAGSVLVVTARPGPESADLGGVVYAFRRAGARLALLCLTRGEASSLNSTRSARLEAIRPWEANLAANVLGISGITVSSYPDGLVHRYPAAELAERVLCAVRRHSAELLLMIDPRTGDLDDLAVARAACIAAGEEGIPVLVGSEPGAGDSWVIDLGAEAATARAIQKCAAAAHESQSQELPALIRRLDARESVESLRWLAAPVPAPSHF
ncbi:MAG: PIG-L family deacetylase [Streptosporangiaceae bacterium]